MAGPGRGVASVPHLDAIFLLLPANPCQAVTGDLLPSPLKVFMPQGSHGRGHGPPLLCALPTARWWEEERETALKKQLFKSVPEVEAISFLLFFSFLRFFL